MQKFFFSADNNIELVRHSDCFLCILKTAMFWETDGKLDNFVLKKFAGTLFRAVLPPPALQ